MATIKILIPFSSTLNSGDAAILLSTLNSIKREFGDEAKVTVASRQASIASCYYPEIDYLKSGNNYRDKLLSNWMIRWPRDKFVFWFYRAFRVVPKFLLSDFENELLNTVRKSDIVLAPGGGYLTDSYVMDFTLLVFYYTFNNRKKLYLYSQSFGPIWKNSSKKFLKLVLAKANKIILRDNESEINVKKLLNRIPENCIVSTDEAFTFCDIDNRKRVLKKKVGISVRNWKFTNIDTADNDYMHSFKMNMKRLCEFLIENYDYAITFISTCQGESLYIDDSVLAKEIKASIEEKFRSSIEVDEQFHRPEELIKLFKEFDLFIGTRMHSIIFNFLNLTPCLGIVYEFKTRELFMRIGLQNYIFDMHSDDYELLKQKVVDLIENRAKLQQILKTEIIKLQETALNNIKIIHQDFKSAR